MTGLSGGEGLAVIGLSGEEGLAVRKMWGTPNGLISILPCPYFPVHTSLSRYKLMKAYMPTVGTMGLDMMFRTCTVQASVNLQ